MTHRSRVDLSMIAVQGPHAREKVWPAVPGSEATTSASQFNAESPRAFGELFIARTGYTGEDGFEIVVPAAHAAALWQALATPAWPLRASARATRCASKPA